MSGCTSTQAVAVSPHRLQFGRWCHQRNKTLGQGDINAAYSGDSIALESRVRKPFRLQGWQCVTTGIQHRSAPAFSSATAYRLVPLANFTGQPTTYREKLIPNSGDDARGDPRGFYHGMAVKYGGRDYVLTGPPIEITAGEPAPTQAELF